MNVPPAAESLTDRSARAAQWRLAASLAGGALQLAVGILLARLLAPVDFGVMALALLFHGLVQPLGDLGIGNAIVQRAALTERHVRTAFTFSVLLGITVMAGLMLVAPAAAVLAREPAMNPVLRTLAVSFALGGPSVVARGLLRRALDFRRQFFIDIAGYVLGFGVVAVGLALGGFGVWSLVWGSLVQSALSSAAFCAAVPHPVRPLLAQPELRGLLRFGAGTAASSCVNFVALNGDNFVAGRWLGPASLGLYTRAYALMNLPHTYAASVVSSVLFPAFAQVQGEPARLSRGYLLATQVTAMVAAPALATLAIAAPHLVPALYGEQWTGAVAPLQILCAAGYFRALYHLGGAVAQSVGWVYHELWRQAAYAALVIAGSLIGSRYGLAGIAAGVSIAIIFMYAATGQLALRATGAPWRRYLRVQAGALATAAVTCAVALSIRVGLENYGASSGTITTAILTGASIPWTLGFLWQLSGPDLDLLRARLPGPCARPVERLRTLRGAHRRA
jgi:O-antigen/teichoic acid export membrane protein